VQYGVGYHPWCTCRLFNFKPGAAVMQQFQLSVITPGSLLDAYHYIKV
jgi:hypothetical protein